MKGMVGIILAGGTGSRLRPLTNCINKNILPVGLKPMILYPIEKLKNIGITKICVITGVEHLGAVVELLRSGKDLGVDITYRVQEQPNGISAAIALAEDFVGDNHFVTILGDNIFDFSLNFIKNQYQQGFSNCALITVKEVSDPERFGVMEYDSQGVPIKIHEKPLAPPSNHAVIGVYAYPPDAFKYIKELKPSPRGELEITDLNNCYLSERRLRTAVAKGFWVDAGNPQAYRDANLWAWSQEEG
jgi:glucose-1-phosphate thymidylyltransferase